MSLVNFFNEADENKKKKSEVLCHSKTQLYFYDFLFVKHKSKITGDYCRSGFEFLECSVERKVMRDWALSYM